MTYAGDRTFIAGDKLIWTYQYPPRKKTPSCSFPDPDSFSKIRTSYGFRKMTARFDFQDCPLIIGEFLAHANIILHFFSPLRPKHKVTHKSFTLDSMEFPRAHFNVSFFTQKPMSKGRGSEALISCGAEMLTGGNLNRLNNQNLGESRYTCYTLEIDGTQALPPLSSINCAVHPFGPQREISLQVFQG